LIGFISAAWLINRYSARHVLVAAVLVMGAASGVAVFIADLQWLVLLRVIQGYAGGAVLIAGQTLVFLAYRRAHQPGLQAVFAIGAVVAPATFAPALQGWLIDSQSWTWIFFCVLPVALASAGIVVAAAGPMGAQVHPQRFDGIGLLLMTVSLVCLTYVLSQGSRWDWFEASRIVWMSLIGVAALLAFVGQQLMMGGRGMLDFRLFSSKDFAFAFIVSFVAGAALFGSAFLIPSFALSVLAFTPLDAGLLLLPSGGLFVAALLLCAYLMQARGVAPFVTVPLGILLIMIAMGWLSGSNRESGADDMMGAILLRGLGLGFLFLSITLIAFGELKRNQFAGGIGLFNTGRQLGGLIGVAGLQTLIEHNHVANLVVLGSHVSAGGAAMLERLSNTTALLSHKGVDAAAAGRASMQLLHRAVNGEAVVIAFDTAFLAVALLFVIAAPLLVAIKIGLARHGKAQADQ